MAEIARITGLAPPTPAGDLPPVAPAAAVKPRTPRDNPAQQDGPAAAGPAAPADNPSEPPPAEADNATALERKLETILKEVLGEDFSSRRLSIAQDEATGRFVYRVIDTRTGEVLKQYPPDEILKIVAQIQQAEGLVLDAKA